MATIVTRSGKGSALTHTEVDANFNNLNNDKLETSAAYVHPNHTGDVTSTADGATVVASNVIDADNLKVTGNGSTSQFLRSDGDGTFTWATPADTDTVYTHPNHSGEVTSTADGATVIADDVVDEANLKVSNAPTNGYFLSAQSGNTGGLTWAAASGGGSLNLISTTTISTSVASVEFTSLSGYESYKFIISGLTFATAGAYPIANFSTDSGSTYPLLRILRAAFASSTSSNVVANYFSNDNHASLILSTGSTSTDLTPSYFIEGSVANNGGNPLGFVNVAFASQDNVFEHGLGSFMFGFTTVPSANVNAMKFSASSGNLTAGKISIYGVSS